ncbi:MAG: hypothetical protein N2596_06455 [Syntrophorhabdaceae bacterium]|nr:hypothetical protein [Syntrophorhabdaceae bacterium]
MKLRKEEHERLIDDFKTLTFQALEETDMDSFIEILMKRDEVIKKIVKENIELDSNEIDFFYDLEKKVSERLEDARKTVVEDIDAIAEKKRAIRKYTPKFPFPPMPVFFDKKG